MRKILLPVDFSEASNNAVRYSLRFFKGEACTFYLLSIYRAWEYTTEELMQASDTDSIYNSLLKENKEKLEEKVRELEDLSKEENFSFHPLLNYNVFTEAINQVIEIEDIDLIIMGTDGVSGAKEAIFGSHTLRVIRKVNSPLLVIPVNHSYKTLRNILYTIDYNNTFDVASAVSFKQLIKKREVLISILKLQAGDAEDKTEAPARARIEEAFKEYHPRYYCVKDVTAAEAINSLVQVLKIQMNVLPVKHEEFLKRFLFGSAISKIIYTSRVPLLIIHQAE